LRSSQTRISRVHSIFFGSLGRRRRRGDEPECEGIIAHLRRWVMRQLGIFSLLLALSSIGHARGTAALTEFYVDPDFAGPVQNGQAATPWSALGGGSGPAWAAINQALQSGDVTVFFSARQASSDTNETANVELYLYRTCAS